MKYKGFDLDGKIAMVTGAGRGIGRAMAIGLAEAGADLILTSRTRTELEEAASEIEQAGRKAEIVVFDISDVERNREGAEAALRAFGRIDVLINNAGVNRPKQVFEVTEEDWDVIFDTNLKGLFFLTQQIGKQMVERRSGKVINISSQAGISGAPIRAPYSASKAGVIQLTKALAIEWAPHNVNVNAIAPTFIVTPLAMTVLSDEDFRKDALGRIPLGRFGEPGDVVGAAIYLASDASSLVTGHTLVVDGGWTVW